MPSYPADLEELSNPAHLLTIVETLEDFAAGSGISLSDTTDTSSKAVALRKAHAALAELFREVSGQTVEEVMAELAGGETEDAVAVCSRCNGTQREPGSPTWRWLDCQACSGMRMGL